MTSGPLLEEGLALAEKAGDGVLRVDARRALAQQRMELGEHERALEEADEAERLLKAVQ